MTWRGENVADTVNNADEVTNAVRTDQMGTRAAASGWPRMSSNGKAGKLVSCTYQAQHIEAQCQCPAPYGGHFGLASVLTTYAPLLESAVYPWVATEIPGKWAVFDGCTTEV